jgi:hypothetical protein
VIGACVGDRGLAGEEVLEAELNLGQGGTLVRRRRHVF